MSTSQEVVIIECDSEGEANSVNTEVGTRSGAAGRILSRENLDGSAATWIVVATTAITTLPKVLDALAKVIEAIKVRSVKVGDHEIRNPKPADIRALHKSLTK